MKINSMFSIDRFEGDFAVCENEKGKFVDIPLKKIPVTAKESDVIIYTTDGFVVDEDETIRRKKEFFAMFRNLSSKN